MPRDDLDSDVRLPSPVRRVVSIVPSLTESIAVTHPGLLVGATDWCTHPADLEVVRVRGTKNPAIEVIRDLAPDVVVANAEENRGPDLDALRDAGLPVWVTAPTTVEQSLESLRRMLSAIIGEAPRWLTEAAEVWRTPYSGPGRDTFAGDVLARLGIDNVFAESAERYPRFDPGELPAYDLVVLPDEPYAFSPDDGPEAFDRPAACVSGRHLTWYGPSLVAARDVLAGQLAP
jgi:ABC-type Fe3+-hydroxamate transport system substrate-binding protein